jgi:hypothetical protein
MMNIRSFNESRFSPDRTSSFKRFATRVRDQAEPISMSFALSSCSRRTGYLLTRVAFQLPPEPVIPVIVSAPTRPL